MIRFIKVTPGGTAGQRPTLPLGGRFTPTQGQALPSPLCGTRHPLCRPFGWVALWRRLAMTGNLNLKGVPVIPC